MPPGQHLLAFNTPVMHFALQKGVVMLIAMWWKKTYRKTSNISRTFVGNNIVDNSDVVGASPVGAAPTTSEFST